jgi:hypothetical protein
MSSRNKNLSWVNKQRKMIKENYGIDSKIIKNGHLKIIFYRNHVTWMWVTGNTPSDINSQKKSLSILRNGLKQYFGVDIDKSDFTLQYTPLTKRKVSPPRN